MTHDAFLGGRLHLHQPARGFRGGIDAVLLAAACPARPGDHVLDLGCGVGTAALCLGVRVPGLRLAGVELQEDYAALARRNAHEAGQEMDVHCADLTRLPDALRARSFDHVIANPPYYERGKGSAAPDPGRDTALAGDTPLTAWCDAATRRLKPKGWLTMIQKADRLGDVLTAMDARLGSIMVQPLAPRTGQEAHLVIVRARKGGRAPLRLAAPIILHNGVSHPGDQDHYTSAISAVLRDAAALPVAD
ncbi:MAG: methyltransferase [Rhodobacterales bacterium]|nr:MAG: methyltransferase [Rhodobacterales bacterium]